MSWFRIRNLKGKAVVYIDDDIGLGGGIHDLLYDLAKADEVELSIDSAGGCARTAQQLIDAIADRTTIATITGTCASAAVLIASSAKRIRIARDGHVMIHPPRQLTFASAKEMREHVQGLDELTARFTDALAKRTADPELARLWLTDGKDFWFDAHEAWNVGLVDEVFDGSRAPRQARKGRKAEPEPMAMPALEKGNEETLLKFLTAFGPVETADPQKVFREVHAVLMSNLRVL